MRSLASVLVAAVLVVPACSKHESFCDTVRALVSSSTSVNVDVRAGDSAATVKAKVDAFARANAAAVRRQVTLLRRLERTAPADLKADVSLVVAAGVTFAYLTMHENRLYLFEGTVPKGAPEPGLFQGSVGLVDAKGGSIRYTDYYSNAIHGLREQEPPPFRVDGGAIQTWPADTAITNPNCPAGLNDPAAPCMTPAAAVGPAAGYGAGAGAGAGGRGTAPR